VMSDPSSFLPITALFWIAGIWRQSYISSLVLSVSDIRFATWSWRYGLRRRYDPTQDFLTKTARVCSLVWTNILPVFFDLPIFSKVIFFWGKICFFKGYGPVTDWITGHAHRPVTWLTHEWGGSGAFGTGSPHLPRTLRK
jgi:hypothetical protein